MHRIPKRAVAAAFAMAAALVIAATALSQSGDPLKQPRVDAGQARAAAEAFLGETIPGANVSAPIDGKTHRLYEVSNAKLSVFVDAHSGKPLMVMDRTARRGSGPAIEKGTAANKAVAYLRAHKIDMPAGDPAVSLVDHGDAKTYEVAWQARSGQALAPSTLMVSLDASTGDFVAMLDDSRPYVAAPDPAIDAGQAADLARAAAGMPGASVVGATLRITFDAAGRQGLTWTVTLRSASDLGAAWVDVDALTGTSAVTGRG